VAGARGGGGKEGASEGEEGASGEEEAAQGGGEGRRGEGRRGEERGGEGRRGEGRRRLLRRRRQHGNKSRQAGRQHARSSAGQQTAEVGRRRGS